VSAKRPLLVPYNKTAKESFYRSGKLPRRAVGQQKLAYYNMAVGGGEPFLNAILSQYYTLRFDDRGGYIYEIFDKIKMDFLIVHRFGKGEYKFTDVIRKDKVIDTYKEDINTINKLIDQIMDKND
jgi:hypothetical protein